MAKQGARGKRGPKRGDLAKQGGPKLRAARPPARGRFSEARASEPTETRARLRDDHGERSGWMDQRSLPPVDPRERPAVPPPSQPEHDTYDSPLVQRYASREMLGLFSPQRRYSTWRRIWIALAESQAELGLAITSQQVAEMRAAVDDIDFQAAARYERQTRHDVMAHIHAFGDAAPSARGIIHLGATSMDIVDNADLILMRDALDLLARRLAGVVSGLADFCEAQAGQPTLGFTHLQPAQLTTVGKRASLWLFDLATDLERFVALRDGLKCRGIRGATGTQASFLSLLNSPAKVEQLEERFAARLGFERCYPVCGQTYSRKIDIEVVGALGSFAAGVHKLCNDIRILALLKEIEEPFAKSQVGSSAMPYKRNPMLCERATGLARYLISLTSSPLMTHAAQMLERTLDDSSNKRLALPDAFLTADAIAVILHRIFDGLVVYPAAIEARIAAELPFIASEEILMAAVAAGGDRQALHERIRGHAQAAGEQVKLKGKPNDLIARLRSDRAFASLDWSQVLDAGHYVGLAAEQTRAFVRTGVRPMLSRLRLAPVGQSVIEI